MSDYTYAEVGATRSGRLPSHYNHLRYRTRIDTSSYATAATALMGFAMHRAAGARVVSDAPRATPGVRLTVTLGPFTVPNRVVWTVEEPGRTGFAYGTLPGHQESGEESFLLTAEPDGIWLSVTAFSRPVRWPVIVAGPLAVYAQRGFARLCGRALRRIGTVNP